MNTFEYDMRKIDGITTMSKAFRCLVARGIKASVDDIASSVWSVRSEEGYRTLQL